MRDGEKVANTQGKRGHSRLLVSGSCKESGMVEGQNLMKLGG